MSVKQAGSLPPSGSPRGSERCILAGPSGKQHSSPENYSYKRKKEQRNFREIFGHRASQNEKLLILHHHSWELISAAELLTV